MMIATSLILAFGGFAALALAMDRHHGQMHRGRPAPRLRRLLMAAGWAALVLSAVPSIAAWGWAFGLTGWAGCLTLVATLLALLLTYAPRTALFMAAGAAPLAAVLALVAAA